MAIVKPFRALHPIASKIAQIAAPPYDVLDQAEALALSQNNPLSFLHVSKSEINLPLNTPNDSPLIYSSAAENLHRLIKNTPFIEAEEALYAYRIQIGDHTQLGLFGCFSLDEYDAGLIKRHELTRQLKENDRTRHTLALKAHTGPTYLTYRDVPEVTQALKKISQTSPLFDFTAEDGVSHTLWKITDTVTLCELFEKTVPTLYIADGHHRAAASNRARKEIIPKNPLQSEIDFFLAAAFPASELQLLPYHRIIKDLGTYTRKTFLEKISMNFQLKTFGATPAPSQPQSIGIYLDQWYQATLSTKNSQLEQILDVELLQAHILEPILGIDNPRTNSRIDFVGGIRGTRELEKRVQTGIAAVGFALHPTSIEEMMRRCDLGGIMPPKSTWFEPKLRDGLLIHRF